MKARWVLLGALVVLVALLLAPKAQRGEPFVPRAGDEVLEKVVAGSVRTPPLQPGDVDGAVAQARELISASRRAGGDPRLLGRAQAVLQPWWTASDAPPPVLLVRATIRQSFHDFSGALGDLDQVVKLQPGDAQAWLTRATVLQVMGRFDEARASCAALERLAPELIVVVCRAQLDGLTGKAGPARDALAAALVKEPNGDQRSWALSVLGDVTAWAGDSEGALKRYREALAIDDTDEYTRGAAADLLVDLGRGGEAGELLRGHTTSDAELLRYVLAVPGDAEARADLEERVAASRRRGDVVHRREESRYALHVEGDGPLALRLAVANFEVQKEPWDVRVLLEAAAGNAEAAAPAIEWMKRTGFEDPRTRALLKKVAP